MSQITQMPKWEGSLGNKKYESGFKFAFVFFILVVLDQLTKYYAKNVFLNYKFAFSLPVPKLLIFIIYALVVMGMLRYYFTHRRNLSLLQNIGWGLIFAGAVSNIAERVILGYVRDWVYIFTGVFNFADGYIIIAIVILLLSGSKNSKLHLPAIG